MAEVITSGKVIQKPELVLEVDDFLPPGLIGVRTRTQDEAGLSFDIGGEGVSSDLPTDGEVDTPGGQTPPGDWSYDRLPVPTDMRIISQTSRVGVDGKMVVDVVIETSDFPGITEFEARIILDGTRK